MDIISKANLQRGLQFGFTAEFTTWMHFEKVFLLPLYSMGAKLTEDIFQSMIKDRKRMPSYLKRKRGDCFRQAKKRYIDAMNKFWKATCMNDHFTLDWNESQGFRVISKTSSLKNLTDALTSYNVCLTPEAFTALKGKYHSLFHDGTQGYILYGPLQYLNHSCTSELSLTRVENSADHSFRLKYEYESDPYLRERPIRKGKEILIKYNKRENLGFLCACPSCK